MKSRFLLLAASCAVTVLAAEQYALGPDSQPQAGVPKGTVTKHILAPGKYYPGTPHNYAIYIPAQYDAAKPAPFMIFMDGSGSLGKGQRVPTVFDNLIAKRELPAMIGIFVDPGVLPALTGQSRFEQTTSPSTSPSRREGQRTSEQLQGWRDRRRRHRPRSHG